VKKYIFLSFFLLLSAYPLGWSKTVRADVTNDRIDDIIRMGMKIVTVQDGASGKLHTVAVGEEYLADISVDDYFSGTKGNDLAVITLPEKGFLTEVYGYRNKRFVKVSDILPGELTFDEELRLFGYATHEWDRHEVLIYWPIIEHEGKLVAAPLVQSAETTLVAAANSTTELKVDLLENTFMMCVATTLDKDVIVFLEDEDATLIKQTKIDSRIGFYGRVVAGRAKTVSLNIDNSQSDKTKSIHVIVKQYHYL